MILLDSDVLLIDQRYQNDPRFGINQQVLQHLLTMAIPRGATVQTILEVVGALSFNVSPPQIPFLWDGIVGQYSLAVFPNPQQRPDYAACSIQEIIQQMQTQMSLGDSVQAVQIARFAPSARCLLTWNARHFVGKIAVPVLTPQEWLQQQSGPTP